MTKKSLNIVHFISSLHRGGAETILFHVVKDLQKRGWTQRVVYIYDGPIHDELRALGIPTYHLTALGLYVNPVLWWRLLNYMRSARPDVMHTALWAANLMGRCIGWLLHIPTVSSLHAVAAHEGKVRNTIDRFLPVRACATIAVSQGIATSVLAAGMCQQRTMRVIPNGIDVADFKRAAQGAQEMPYVVDGQTWVVGAVGRLVPVKKFDLLIRVFAKLVQKHSNARLLIIGTGPEEQALRSLIALQSCADFIELITHKKAAPYYRAFHCFVQPSEFEGLSLALLEALAMEVPVIVTGKDGSHEVVTHGVTGLVIPANNEDAFYEALVEMHVNKRQAQNLRTAGYEQVMQSYSLTSMVDSYERIFVQRIVS